MSVWKLHGPDGTVISLSEVVMRQEVQAFEPHRPDVFDPNLPWQLPGEVQYRERTIITAAVDGSETEWAPRARESGHE